MGSKGGPGSCILMHLIERGLGVGLCEEESLWAWLIGQVKGEGKNKKEKETANKEKEKWLRHGVYLDIVVVPGLFMLRMQPIRFRSELASFDSHFNCSTRFRFEFETCNSLHFENSKLKLQIFVSLG